MPRTTAAGKYISLYRKIRDQGMYLHAGPGQQQQQQAVRDAMTAENVGVGSSTVPAVRLSSDRRGGAGNSSSFNINSKLCSIRE